MIKKIIALIIVVITGLAAVPVSAARSADEIFWRFVQGPVDVFLETQVPVYVEEPVLAEPFSAGRLSDEFVGRGLAKANFVRFLAGLGDDLFVDNVLNNRGQHGAALLAASAQLTHSPPRPNGMNDDFFQLARLGTSTGNLSWGANSLHEAVLAYMYNSDRQGIAHLGHRRWILNPYLLRVGFGHVFRFSSMQVLDRSRSTVSYDTIAWPAAGSFPVEYMAGTQAWSLSLNPLIYDSSRTDNISVLLVRTNDGRSWRFTAANTNPAGRFFSVSTHGFGVPFCIIFRPDGIARYHPNDRFLVEVSGVYRLDGQPAAISYEVEFFRLFGSITLTLGNGVATSATVDGTETFELDPGGGAVPIIDEESGRTLIPVRAVVERMGGTVDFDAETQLLTIEYRGRTVEMTVGEGAATVNGVDFNLDVPPQIIDGRTMIPVRFISENLGANVRWCEDTQSITIIYLP